MDASKTATPADALISLLQSRLSADGAQAFGHMVLYTSFGVVRGRTGFSFAQEFISPASDQAVQASQGQGVIELNNVTVEHYSNHLPTASFDRLYVRLDDVRGFALVNLQGQG